MRRPLTSRERRGAALMILALVLCLAYWLLIDSWFPRKHPVHASRPQWPGDPADLLVLAAR